MTMRHVLLFSFLCCVLNPFAQKIKGTWYFSIAPTLANTINTYTNHPSTNYTDSLKKLDRWRSAIGGSALYGMEMANKNKLFFGLQYHNAGFTRKRENYKFLDTLHPDIGIMSDISQTGNNYINFNYRYHYLTIPVFYSMQVSGRTMKASTIHWFCGGSVSVLMKHDVRAVFNGFTSRGKGVFVLDDKKDNASRININLQTGFRLENQLYGKNSFIFVQPSLYVPLTSANYSKERHHLYSICVDVGFIFKPGEKI